MKKSLYQQFSEYGQPEIYDSEKQFLRYWSDEAKFLVKVLTEKAPEGSKVHILESQVSLTLIIRKRERIL